MDKIYAVVNPVSANGRTRKEWPQFEKRLKDSGYEFDWALTEYPGHGTELTRNALKNGYKVIMSVGGDGTMNEVVNGFFENGRTVAPDSRLVVFSRGTGCDLIRTLEMKKDIEGVLAVLERNRTKQVDVGRADFADKYGMPVTRYFLNVADIGIGAETANRVNMHSKLLKGFLCFMLSAVSTMILYRNKFFEVEIDNEVVLKDRVNSVVVANGRYFGGGMMIAPEALMDDGVFDIVIIGDISKPDMIRSFPLIYEGKHMNHPKLSFYRGKKVKVKSGGEALIEVDGEIPGSGEVEFVLLPGALNIMM